MSCERGEHQLHSYHWNPRSGYKCVDEQLGLWRRTDSIPYPMSWWCISCHRHVNIPRATPFVVEPAGMPYVVRLYPLEKKKLV
jgi:hypothetical protein